MGHFRRRGQDFRRRVSGAAPRKITWWGCPGLRLVAELRLCGAVQGKPMMNRFGQLGLTTVSNGLNFVAQTIGILSQTHGQMYAYVMATVRNPTPTTSFKRTHTNPAKVVCTRPDQGCIPMWDLNKSC